MNKNVVLERVILKNFNSFQNDEVPLSSGLTIITGPNGAGKSTVFQGIKFAMGSNERGERSNKWSNFIRIGEKAGSVEIHIRVDGELYKIRRVIYDDQAPYFQIMEPGKNKFRNTTASKIHDLIMDLKFNPDNVFAFVSQGDVNNIRKMKVMEIREFLEIGLGLHDLRVKIQERKSEIGEMDKQINSLNSQKDNASYELEILKPQLKKLEEKQELEKKKDLLEKEKLWLNRNKLQHEIESISEDIEKSYNERKDTENNRLYQEQELSTISNDIEIKTESIQKLIGQVSSLSTEEKSLNDKIKEWQGGKDTLAQDILNLESKLKTLGIDLEKNTNDFEIVNEEIEKYRFEHGIANGELKKIRDERNKNEKLREKNKDILNNLDNLNNKKIEHETQIKSHKTNISQNEKQIEKYMDNIKNISQEIEKFKWFSKKPEENTRVSLEQKKEKIQTYLEKYNLKIDRLEDQNKKLENQAEKLKTATLMKETPKSREIQNLIREIKDRNLDVIGPIIDYIQFNPKIGNAVDAILSKYVLNSFIAKNKSDFLLLQSLIKQNRAKCNVYQPFDKNIIPNKRIKIDREQGIIGYIADLIKPLDHNDGVEKVIRSICRNTLLVRDKSIGYDFIKDESNSYKGKIVTLDGTVLRSYDYVMESRASESEGQKYKNPIEQKEKLEELLVNLAENRKLLEGYITKRDQLIKKEKIVLARLKNIDSLEVSYRKMTIISEQKQKLLDEKKKNIEEKNEFSKNLRIIEQQLNDLKRSLPKNLDEINQFFENFQKRSEELEEKITILSNLLLKKEIERNKHELKIEKIKEELADGTVRLNDMKTELKSRNTEILKMIHRISDIKDEITSLNHEQKECKKEIDSLKEFKKSAEEKLIEIKTLISEIEIKIENLMAEKYQKEQLLNEIKLDFSEIEANYEERSIQEVENDLKIVYEKLREYYDVSEDLLSRKQYLESKIQKILLRKQKLHQEIEEAKIAEEKLEKEFRSKFDENLSIIANNINKRFQDAGIRREGKLELVGNLDNLGVEIYVKFNEGTERQLSSLSGGEQTMFAISLMLTLQSLHPSPLCIFDEAQMFLDQENSHEVAKLIKNATHNGIQFVILVPDATKTLLELADSVIGIAKNGKQDASTVVEIPYFPFNQ